MYINIKEYSAKKLEYSITYPLHLFIVEQRNTIFQHFNRNFNET